jgi:CBS domain containing-hemolysin-like protein
MSELTAILIWLLLLLLNGLFTAGGSALKNCHRAQLKRLEDEEVPGARLAGRLVEEATRLILALRVGQGILRLSTIVLGLVAYVLMVGVESITPLGLSAALVVIWLVLALVLFIIENLVLRSPNQWAVRLAIPMAAYIALWRPLSWMLGRFSQRLSDSPRGRAFPVVTEEQIMTLVDAGEEGGMIEQDEREMIYSIFQLGDTLVREVMVPRIDILAFDENTPMIAATDELLRTGFSRAPVFRGSIDAIIGIVYGKDLLAVWRKGEQDGTVSGFLREAYFVPEAKKVDDLLTEMQARRIQMAIVVDEYGGTAGLVTFEDIVEEIVGEIHDEYDTAEELPYRKIGEQEYIFRGRIDIDDFNLITGAGLPKGAGETLGGFIYSQLGRIPSPGETLSVGGLQMVVEQVVGKRIRKVRAIRNAAPGAESKDGPDETVRSNAK